MAEPILKVSNLETLWPDHRHPRRVLRRAAGRHRHHPGRQWCGKTTVLKTICGVMDAQKGSVVLPAAKFATWTPTRSCAWASPRAWRREVFLPCVKNLYGSFTRRDADGVAEDSATVFDYSRSLRERAEQRAGSLSGGEQQMLAISRALMARPRLMLMDEPSLGLSPRLVKEIFDIIVRITASEVSRSYSWNRMPTWRSGSATTATCWRSAALWPTPARA